MGQQVLKVNYSFQVDLVHFDLVISIFYVTRHSN